MIQLSHINKITKKANNMQTLDKLQKQLLLGTEINAILKQSNKLLDIIKENQDYSYKLQEESNRLEKEIEAEKLRSSDDVKGGW
jgi:hypothetical protein